MIEKQTGVNAYTQMDELVMSTRPGADGLIMLPYFQGSGIPELNERAGGILWHHCDSYKGTFYQSYYGRSGNCLRRMLECEQKLGAEMTEIRSLGGGSKSKAWCQIKADILGIPVKVIDNSEVLHVWDVPFLPGWQMVYGILWKKLRNSLFQ